MIAIRFNITTQLANFLHLDSIRPSDSQSAWIPSIQSNSLKLDPNASRNASGATTGASANSAFTFDAVLTGTPNKPVYTTVARSHVQAAMEGYNAVIFAYGQTASGKTFTLSGDEDEPGIIPRSMRDVFGFIRRTPEREYLLRCSYLEIYNETIIDLLAPPMSAKANPVQIQGGAGGDIILSPLREEVVTSLKGVKDVLKRGEGNRRTACTDWNERSSRSHSVFRLVVESRERGSSSSALDEEDEDVPSTPPMVNGRHTPGLNGRQTPGLNGRQTPGLNGRQTPGPGGPRLQARGGRSVQTSVLVCRYSPYIAEIFSSFFRRVSLILLALRKRLRTRRGQEKGNISTQGQFHLYAFSLSAITNDYLSVCSP